MPMSTVSLVVAVVGASALSASERVLPSDSDSARYAGSPVGPHVEHPHLEASKRYDCLAARRRVSHARASRHMMSSRAPSSVAGRPMSSPLHKHATR